MKKNNIETGKIGENIACDFLIKNRYKILFRNYYIRHDEIDIIAKSFSGVLVFIEVKTFTNKSSSGIMPEDNLTIDKLKKITRACRLFAGSHRGLIDDKKGWQIDLVAIVLKEDGDNLISHYENIT
jgi:putative endonuclease